MARHGTSIRLGSRSDAGPESVNGHRLATPAPAAVPEVALEQAEIFAHLGADRLHAVRPLLRERRFARHEILFFEGAEAESLWAIRRGSVRLCKISPDGSVTTLETLGPGEVFGALSALDAPMYSTSAEASGDVAVWCLPRSVFLRLLADVPGLAVETLRVVTRRLHAAQDQLRAFARDTAPSRLARELLRAARDGEAHVTRRVLAEAAGTTVETAIRVLRRLEREGLIAGGVRRIRVLDAPVLQRLADGAGAPPSRRPRSP